MMRANLSTTEHNLSIAGHQDNTYVNVLKLESVRMSPLTLRKVCKDVANEGHSVSILWVALIGNILATFLQCEWNPSLQTLIKTDLTFLFYTDFLIKNIQMLPASNASSFEGLKNEYILS